LKVVFRFLLVIYFCYIAAPTCFSGASENEFVSTTKCLRQDHFDILTVQIDYRIARLLPTMTESTDLKSSASSPEIIDLSLSLSNVAPLEITRRKIGQLNVDYNGCFMTDDSDDANHRSFSNDSMINNSTTNVLASDHSPSNTNLSIGVAQPADWFGKAGILSTSVDSANNLEETESRKNLPPGDVQERMRCGSGDQWGVLAHCVSIRTMLPHCLGMLTCI